MRAVQQYGMPPGDRFRDRYAGTLPILLKHVIYEYLVIKLSCIDFTR